VVLSGRWRGTPVRRRNEYSPLPPHTSGWQSLRLGHLARGLDSRREPLKRLPDLCGAVVDGYSVEAAARGSTLNYQVDRGPTSTCCQSSGIPASSTGPPPPHRNPWISVKCPHVTLRKPDGNGPSETSTPVAGQLRCVLSPSGAVGRPLRDNRRCSA